MAAGVTNTLWSMEDIVSLIDAANEKPAKVDMGDMLVG